MILFIVTVGCLAPLVAMYRQYTVNAYYEQRIPIRLVDYRDPLPNMATIRGQLQHWGFGRFIETLSMSGKPYFLQLEGCEVDRQTSQLIVAWSREWETLIVRSADERWTDENTNDLRSLMNLKLLGLSYTGISEKSMDSISQLTQLEKLGLAGSSIHDSDLEKLQTLRRLRILNISQTLITSEGLKDVAALPSLEVLSVERCELLAIDPTIFEPFHGHRHLRALRIDDRFSERDVAAIKEILPNVEMWIVPLKEPEAIVPPAHPEGSGGPGF